MTFAENSIFSKQSEVPNFPRLSSLNKCFHSSPPLPPSPHPQNNHQRLNKWPQAGIHMTCLDFNIPQDPIKNLLYLCRERTIFHVTCIIKLRCGCVTIDAHTCSLVHHTPQSKGKRGLVTSHTVSCSHGMQ